MDDAYQIRLEKIVLFGSRTRGDTLTDSDDTIGEKATLSTDGVEHILEKTAIFLVCNQGTWTAGLEIDQIRLKNQFSL